MTLREKLSEVQHEIWSHWMKYLFSVCEQNGNGSLTIPVDKVKHWQRQMDTPYSDLTEREKDSDREQADKVLTIINQIVA